MPHHALLATAAAALSGSRRRKPLDPTVKDVGIIRACRPFGKRDVGFAHG